jgi:hypothetical protein
VDAIRPHWAAWTFLVYAGGLTVLGAAGGWLSYFDATSGAAGYAAWALVVFALLAAQALVFRRTGHPVAAGVFAFVGVSMFVAFIAALWTWFGWEGADSSSAFGGFHLSRLLLELLWLATTLVALRAFRFPLIVAQAALAGWLLVTDLISNGGGWSATVTFAVGLAYLVIAAGVSRPYGFWLHVGSGMLIGGSLLWFWHGGNVEWTLIVIASVAYVLFARISGRSSWAVLGAVGLLLASAHFSLEWAHVQVAFFSSGHGGRDWVPPLVFTCTGALLVALGLLAARRGPQVGHELT